MIDYDLLIALNKQRIQELHAEASRVRLVSTIRRLSRSRQRGDQPMSPAVVTGMQARQSEAEKGR